MRFFHAIGIPWIIPALLVLSACTRTDEGTRARTGETIPEPAPGLAHVRYVNALSVNAGAELYVGDTRLVGGGRQAETGYREVASGRHEFELRDPGKGTAEPLAENSEGLRRDAHHTVIAYNDENGKATLRVVSDEEAAPSAGKAKVRVIDAAARAGDFDLYYSGQKDKLAGEPTIGAVSGWKEVDAVSQPLEFGMRDDKAKRITVPEVRLQAGKLYTFVVTDGHKAGEPLHVITLQNEPTKLPVAPPTVPVT